MRNDIKFGLTIGGLLVFILIIWVAVVNRGAKKAATSNDVAIVDSGKSADSTAAPADMTPIPTPPAAAPVTTVTPPPSFAPSPAASPTPAPADSSAGEPAGSHDWSRLLTDGQDSAALAAPAGNGNNGTVVTAADTHVGSTPDLEDASPLTSIGPATQPIAARTHTVQEGETFSTIAADVYGSSKYYHRLVDANPNVNPNRLKIGQVIQVPALDEDSSAAATASNSPSNPPSAADQAPIDSTRSYRVQSGDTLERISRKLYGDGQEWQKIYDLNKDQIGSNPGRLTLNMVLRLPEPPTVATAN